MRKETKATKIPEKVKTEKRKHMKAYIKWYLKMIYPDWEETKLIYKKGT